MILRERKKRVLYLKRRRERPETFLPLSGIERVKGRVKRKRERRRTGKVRTTRVRSPRTPLPEVSTAKCCSHINLSKVRLIILAYLYFLFICRDKFQDEVYFPWCEIFFDQK